MVNYEIIGHGFIIEFPPFLFVKFGICQNKGQFPYWNRFLPTWNRSFPTRNWRFPIGN